MKNSLCSLLSSVVLICSLTAQATEINMVWHQVTANPSLIMRAQPTLKANQRGRIPFGSKVKVLEKVGQRQALSGYVGQWVKIIWRGEEVYVFDAFLIRLQDPITKEN